MIFPTQGSNLHLLLAGGFFTVELPGKPVAHLQCAYYGELEGTVHVLMGSLGMLADLTSECLGPFPPSELSPILHTKAILSVGVMFCIPWILLGDSQWGEF